MLTCIDDLESGRRLKRQASVTVTTSYLYTIKNARRMLMDYEDACNTHFLLDDIDMTFRNGYITWLASNGKSPNYIQTLIRPIYTTMRHALEEGLTTNDAFMVRGFVPAGVHSDAVFLSPKRLQELITFDISRAKTTKKLFGKKDIQRLGIARDIFIVGCLTGQRISDYKRINRSMITQIDHKQFLDITQQKSRKKVLIPLDRRVRHIIDKYHGTLPKIYEPTFNRDLRLIAELLGWTEPTRFPTSRHSRFCDMLSSHTARRTFATNAYAYGVPLASIMAVTGHSTEEKLRIYLHLQAQDKALLAARDLDGFLTLSHTKE